MRKLFVALALATPASAHCVSHGSLASSHLIATRCSSPVVMAKAKSKKSKKASVAPAKAPAKKGFGATKVVEKKTKDFGKPLQDLVRQGKALAKLVSQESDEAADPMKWFQLAAGAANLEEYAEARVVMEAGVRYCGDENSELLVQALGQMRRKGPSDEIEQAGLSVEWPGKGDETAYDAKSMEYLRLSARAWPNDCPRGTMYPSGHGAIAVSTTPVLDPSECAWVVEQAERTARERWLSDHADSKNIGTDMIWAKGFPDRLWLREVPGVVEWFEHRLRCARGRWRGILWPTRSLPTVTLVSPVSSLNVCCAFVRAPGRASSRCCNRAIRRPSPPPTCCAATTPSYHATMPTA